MSSANRNFLATLNNAKIMPLLGSMDEFTAGVFDKDRLVKGCLLDRGRESPLFPIAQRLEGTYIFGGYMFAHFGHFNWESLSRLYAIKRCKPFPLIFLSPNTKIFPWQRNYLRMLGLRNELILLKDPVEVENLAYAPAGSELYPPFILDEQLEAMAVFSGGKPEAGKRIWLSRSRFKSGGIVNEAEIEAELIKMGWTIVAPETLPFQAQVANLLSAEYVAGFDGSAFYSVLLTRECRAKFFIFSRRNFIPKELPYLFSKKRLDYQEFVFDVDYVSGHRALARFELRNTRPLFDIMHNLS